MVDCGQLVLSWYKSGCRLSCLQFYDFILGKHVAECGIIVAWQSRQDRDGLYDARNSQPKRINDTSPTCTCILSQSDIYIHVHVVEVHIHVYTLCVEVSVCSI